MAAVAAEKGLARLRAWGEGFWDFAREQPQQLRLQRYWDYRGIDPEQVGADLFAEFRALNEAIVGGLRAAFAAGIDDGSLRAEIDVELCMAHYAYGLRGAMGRALFPAYSFAPAEPEATVASFIDLFTRAIARNADPRGE